MNKVQITVRKTDLRVGELLRAANRIMGKKFLLLVGLSTLALLGATVVPLVLDGALIVGLLICFQRVIADEEIGVENLFEGFQKFAEALIARLVLLAIQLVLMLFMLPSCVLIFFGLSQHSDGIVILGYVTCMMIAVPISIFLYAHSGLTFALIADHDIKGVEAAKLAARAVISNPLATAKLSGTIFGLLIVGYMLCGIGILIAMPIIALLLWLASHELFEVEESPEPPISLAE